jgi:hypothetical protein
MRLLFWFYIIIILSGTLYSQDVKKIVSFTYHIKQNWYFIDSKVKFSDGNVKNIKDSVAISDINLKNKLTLNCKIKDDWYVCKRCYRYKGVTKCIKDSVLLFFPFSSSAGHNDTNSVLEFSYRLMKSQEFRLYKNDSVNNVIRLVLLSNDTTKIYLIKQLNKKTKIHKKIVLERNDNKFVILEDTVFFTTINSTLLNKHFHKCYNDEFINYLFPKNFLIEGFYNNKYFCKMGEYIYINKKCKINKRYPFIK